MKSATLIMFLTFLFTACEQPIVEQAPLNQQDIDSLTNNKALSCVPNSVAHESCSEFKPNALEASIIQTCSNDGKSRMSTQCLIKSCISGFTNINNECVPQSCTPGTKYTATCTNEVSGASIAT